MSRDRHPENGPEEVVRFRDVVEHGGHAWVLARDATDWFYECLKCGDRAHVLSIPEMNKAVEHSYWYMPLRHRAPWNQERTVQVMGADGRITEEYHPPYPPCPNAADPTPQVALLKRGPLVAVAGRG